MKQLAEMMASSTLPVGSRSLNSAVRSPRLQHDRKKTYDPKIEVFLVLRVCLPSDLCGTFVMRVEKKRSWKDVEIVSKCSIFVA